jgi:tetratricopeptide (TPR) repeat protein
MISQSPPKTPVGTGRWDQRWHVAGLCLGLAAITFAVFGQTLHHEFINLDDGTYVFDNPLVAQGLTLKGIVWAFTHVDCHLYHPLTMLSLMGDYQLHGLQPGGYHLTNVLLHTASAILLFLVLRQMTGAFWRSAFVAAVFAIHPLRVESVAWVAERKDVLSAFFFMLTLGAYVRYVRKPDSPGRYLMVVAAFVPALLSKPSMVTLPFVLLLLDYWPLRRFEQPRRLPGLVLEKVPLLALAAGACVMTVLAAGKGVATLANVPMPSRLGNALVSNAIYLRQMIWPEGLAPFYPYPLNGLPAWEVVTAGMLLAGLLAIALDQRRKRPWMLVGWLWYLGMLTPMIGIVQVGAFAHADRMTYLPQIGIYVALTWLVAEWRVSRAALGGLMAGVIGALMVCAWIQTAHWKDNETLWRHTLACTTRNDMAHNNLGQALLQKGSVEEAIIQCQEALEINPNSVDAHLTLGQALLQKGNVDEAFIQYQEALKINPNSVDAHLNLGNVLCQKGELDEGISQFERALQIRPDDAAAHNSLGSALCQKGKSDEGISHFERALQTKPGFAAAHYNLGLALLQKGRASEAITHFQKALQIAPANPRIQNKLAWLLATSPEASLRNGNMAVELAQQADALAGGKDPVILHTFAAALAEAGRFSEAVETAQRALRLAEAQSNDALAGQLQSEMKLYQAGSPFHGPGQTH